ncbi:DNA damage-induced apoptosis suppressor protein [Bombina bombina]|uniref:DNA damage-induced apoptosis suppressor protein n=1 Tax=Bombina bombina TaxID=8345 RepID=UPI00235ADA49|nr:DNA damage-induced apoptosis suppressor protein [Bombina bombina]XP_053564643.1 DNA damage-induced apoptosis suppressor protein [Bombina bombina]XP_053564644.1 DNA damage-induced apoptosis suppressor protein [Bombina bombina]
MNGKRKFLIATVLSIQDSSFTYPACQNCFSRLIQTSNRYECLKCSSTIKDVAYRYKLSLKVAEDNKLYTITVFGSCLEKIFGTSADSLQRYILDSCQANLSSDRLQDLLLQAAEYCFIGKSFLFGVKIPVNHSEESASSSVSVYGSNRHMVACQIALPNDDPLGYTVFTYYSQLIHAYLNDIQLNDRSFASSNNSNTETNHFRSSESICDFQSGCHPFDFWHQSFGIQPLLNISREASVLERSSCTEHSFSERNRHFYSPLQAKPDFSYSNLHQDQVTDRLATDTAHIFVSSALRAEDSTLSGNISATASHLCADQKYCSPLQNTSSVQRKCSNLKTSCRQEICLHKPWSSVSSKSHLNSLCSPDFSSKNEKAAGTNQDDVEIWDDFLFSESLSEFIAKVETNEYTKSQLSFKPSKCYFRARTNSSDTRFCRTSINFIRTPTSQNTTGTLTATSENSISGMKETDDCFAQNTVCQVPQHASKLKSIKRISAALFPYGPNPVLSYEKQSQYSNESNTHSCTLASPPKEIYLTYEKPRISPNLISESIYGLPKNNSVFSFNQHNENHSKCFLSPIFSGISDKTMAAIKSCQKLQKGNICSDFEEKSLDNEKSEWFVTEMEEPKGMDQSNKLDHSDSYNGSADMFDADDTVNNMMESFSDKIVKQNITVAPFIEFSSTSSAFLQFVEEKFPQVGHLVPYSQSTPVAKNLTRPSGLGISKLLNKTLTDKSAILNRKSCYSLRNCLLKKVAHSLLDKKAAIFCAEETFLQTIKSPILGGCRSNSLKCMSNTFFKSATKTQTCTTKGLIENFTTCKAAKKKYILENKENYTSQPKDENKNIDEIKSKSVVLYLERLGVCSAAYVKPNEMDRTLNNTLEKTVNLSPVDSLPFSSEGEVSTLCQTNNLPSDWSPELFAEKTISQQCNNLQRRLF